MKFQSTPFTPDQNDGNHVFVFGSNLAGRHGKGAAYIARYAWNAISGIGDGPNGEAYAIPTKDAMLRTLPLNSIVISVYRFVEFATSQPDRTFLVTRIGCGLAGYRDEQIAPMFRGAPDNCVFQSEWKEFLI